MTIRSKILLLSFFPIATLLYFVWHEAGEWLELKDNLQKKYEQVVKSEGLSMIVHELQKERGESSGFLASGGLKGFDRLSEQRMETDRSIKKLEALVQEKSKDPVDLTAFDGLAMMRTQVNDLKTTPARSEEYYTAKIATLISEMLSIANSNRTGETKNDFLAHTHILYAKENLGQIRAMLYALFTAKRFEGYTIERLGALKGSYDLNIRFFLNEAPDDVKKIYADRFKGPAVKTTMDMIETAFLNFKDDRFEVDPDVWFDSATSVINILKEIEYYCLSDFKQHTISNLKQATGDTTIKLATVAAVLALIFALAFFTLKNLFSASRKLEGDIRTIMETKDFSRRVTIASRDEIGFIAGTFNALLNTISELMTEKDRLAETDPLTQIYNRLKFERLFDLEIRRAQRYKTALALIMFDVDHFKRINDTYGHHLGDYVLVELAGIVNESIRDVDIFARWGGEEFMVLAPEIALAEAMDLAERLRTAIEFFSFKEVGKVTCSFGATALKEDDDVTALSKRADDALYRAKERGRNRVETMDV